MPDFLVLATVAIAAAVAAHAQQTAGPVSVSGTVMNTATSAPVPYAQVTLMPPGDETLTDAAGGFQFPKVQPGGHIVRAGKTGFVSAGGRAGKDSVSLQDSREKHVIWLTPLSSIRGRIAGDDGEPIAGVTVLALQSSVERGHRRNTVVRTVQTGDRGEYRMTQLHPGGYLVRAAGQSTQTPYYGGTRTPLATREGFAPQYFGGSRDAAGASVVRLQPGVDARADFSVAMQPGHNIRGRITNLKPHSMAELRLSGGDEDSGENRNSLELATGEFEIHGVLDGAYRLRAFQRGDGDQWLFAERDVVLGGSDLDGVALTLGTPPAMKGRLRVEGASKTPVMDFSTALLPQDCALPQSPALDQRISVVAADGTFEIQSAFPGRHWISFLAGPGLYVGSAHVGGTDILATQEFVFAPGATPEMEIVLRTDGGRVTGTIAPAVLSEGAITLFLVPEPCNRPAAVAYAGSGAGFSFPDAAPGRYRLHAWKDSAEVEYGSPNVLCALARSGTPVEIKTGEVTKVSVQALTEEPK